jgi:hypothetical protein
MRFWRASFIIATRPLIYRPADSLTSNALRAEIIPTILLSEKGLLELKNSL